MDLNALKLEHLRKSYGKKTVIPDLSFEVKRGEIVGLIGPNGAGKTTTMKMILDLARPNQGKICICGKDLRERREEALKNVSGVIETPALYSYLSGTQHLKMAAAYRGAEKADLEEMVEFTGFADRLKEPVGRYSMGMRQKLSLAMCLLAKPGLLVLDEPANGMDPEGVIALRHKMQEAAEKGIGILISSHILDELQKTADRFLFLKQGELLADTKNSGTENMEELYLKILRGNAYEYTVMD